MYDVDGVVAAERLGQNVVYARGFQHRSRGAASDDAGARAGRAQHHHTRGRLTLHGMGDGAADQRHAEEVLARLLHTLRDRGGHFLGLAVADTDHAVAVADHHQRGEAEPATTLDHLGDPVDGHHALDQVALLAVTSAATATVVASTATTVPAVAAAAVATSLGGRRPATSLLGHHAVLPVAPIAPFTSTQVIRT